jgi:hypothetical protein
MKIVDLIGGGSLGGKSAQELLPSGRKNTLFTLMIYLAEF